MPDRAALAFTLGGLRFRLVAGDPAVRRRARSGFEPWRTALDGGAVPPDSAVELRLRRLARVEAGRRRSTGADWSADGGAGYRVASRWFRIAADAAGRRLDADVDASFGLGDFYRAALGVALALRDGFLLHAAALEIPGRGVHLFCGPSGYGKTTLCRQVPPSAVLADDAVGVRVLDEEEERRGKREEGREDRVQGT